ncbi:hypothetical protein AAMO2058_001592600 [Amorphochlora amoebiformis]
MWKKRDDDQVILRYTSELKDASKFLANCILSIFDRLGRSVHAVLKNFNDPTKADETPNLFVPLSLYVVIIRRILGNLAGRKIRLDDCEVFRIHTRANTQRIVRREYLEASWGRRPVQSTPDYPFNIRYSRTSEDLKCIFVAVAKRANGTMVLSYTQKLRKIA